MTKTQKQEIRHSVCYKERCLNAEYFIRKTFELRVNAADGTFI